MYLKFLVLLVSVLIVTGCANQQVSAPKAEVVTKITVYENKEKGIPSIISNKALISFKTF